MSNEDHELGADRKELAVFGFGTSAGPSEVSAEPQRSVEPSPVPGLRSEDRASDQNAGSSDADQRTRAMTEATRFFVRLAGGLALLGLVWILFSRFVAPAVIESAYHGESFPFLNSMISGQTKHPVEHYLESWKLLSWRIIGILFVVGLIPLPLVATGPEVQKYIGARYRKTLALRPEVINTILALSGAVVVFYLYYFHPVGYVILMTEDYWAEYGSFVSWAMAACFLGWILVRHRELRRPGIFLLFVGALFVGMEEISWGQRVLRISSPAVFLQHNIQREMNFHNLVLITSIQYVTIGIAMLLWCTLLPILSNKWRRIREWCKKLGIPIVPLHVWPLFFLAISFLSVIRFRLIRSSEFAELFVGFAMAVLSLDLVLTTRGGAKVERPSVIVAVAGMTGNLVVLTAFLVHFYSGVGILRNELNLFAATRYPSAGMYRQAVALFEYLDQNSHLLTAETRFRHGALLIQRGKSEKAQEILERALADQDSYKDRWPKDPVPYRVSAQVLTLLGRQEEADAAFQKAIEKDQRRLENVADSRDEAWIRWSLAETFFAMGNLEAATNQWSIARARATDSKTRHLIDQWKQENLEGCLDSKCSGRMGLARP